MARDASLGLLTMIHSLLGLLAKVEVSDPASSLNSKLIYFAINEITRQCRRSTELDNSFFSFKFLAGIRAYMC